MTSFVFDTGVLSLFYAEDKRIRPVIDEVARKGDQGLISAITLAEFYYKTCQTVGREVADLWCNQLSERMEVVGADVSVSLSAGHEKCRNSRLSLADSYALALAKLSHGVLLTTDSELGKNKEVQVRHFQV